MRERLFAFNQWQRERGRASAPHATLAQLRDAMRVADDSESSDDADAFARARLRLPAAGDRGCASDSVSDAAAAAAADADTAESADADEHEDDLLAQLDAALAAAERDAMLLDDECASAASANDD